MCMEPVLPPRESSEIAEISCESSGIYRHESIIGQTSPGKDGSQRVDHFNK
jgi:hypothetical protein